MNNPKKVIVTGISGQDGSYMVDYLLANTDHEIYGMVRRTSNPNYENVEHNFNNPRFNLIYGDLSDSSSIDKVVSNIKPDYFINLAAQSFVKSSWDLPEMTMDVNSTGVMRCLESIVKYCPDCRFYNAGSSEEFGKVEYSPQDENHPFRPQSPYGASKVSARQVVRTYRASFNLYAIQGILFNHESPRRGEEFVTRKITKGVARIKHELDNKNFEPIPIELGNLDAKRDWSHAKDFVESIWIMLNQEEYNENIWKNNPRFKNFNNIDIINIKNGLVGLNDNSLESFLSKDIKEYVISSDETHSIKEFVELAFNAAGIEGVWHGEKENTKYLLSDDGFLATKRCVPLVVVNPEFYRPAEVELLLGDSTKARNELGWKPKYNLNQLIQEMVENDIKKYEKDNS